MSKRILSITAYDLLDQINYTARIREYRDYEDDESDLVCTIAGQIPGHGHPFWPHWLADVLQALQEEL